MSYCAELEVNRNGEKAEGICTGCRVAVALSEGARAGLAGGYPFFQCGGAAASLFLLCPSCLPPADPAHSSSPSSSIPSFASPPPSVIPIPLPCGHHRGWLLPVYEYTAFSSSSSSSSLPPPPPP